MSFLFLCNTAGNTATAQSTAGVGTTATGYDIKKVIAGPRSTFHRATAGAGGVGVGYEFTADLDLDYIVVARADKMLTQNTTRVRVKERNSGGTWSNLAGVDYNPLTSANLLGIKTQDLVFSITQSVKRGLALYSVPLAGTDAQMVSKFYGCKAFEFVGSAPALGATTEILDIGSRFTPQNGHIDYEVEARFSISFGPVSRAYIALFKALPQLRNWPLFLYDTAGDLWTHKLEHVLIEDWTETIVESNLHGLSITFLRLRHYE